MSIRNNGGCSVYITHDEIRRFSSDSRQRGQLFKRIGHFTVKIVDDFSAHSDDIPCFCSEKAAGADKLLDILGSRRREILGGFIFCEQRGRYKVHPCIGALGGKPCSYEKLKRIFGIQRAYRFGIFLFECLYCKNCSFFFGHKIILRDTNTK